MTKTKFLLAFMLLICLCVPTYNSFAQFSFANDQTTTVQADESEVKDTKDKKDKKKDKDNDKDNVDINLKFLLLLLINLATLVIITLFIYYPNNKQIESIFTFFMFNLLIFMLTFVLNKIKISMGAAFGLFAVFSMLRYRTEGITMKDMTYLFIFIAIGLISAIQLEYYELAIINGTIIFFTFALDSKVFFRRENSKKIEYENIELIKPQNMSLLIADLQTRTGLKIHRVNIEKIDFLKDTANLMVYYYD